MLKKSKFNLTLSCIALQYAYANPIFSSRNVNLTSNVKVDC